MIYLKIRKMEDDCCWLVQLISDLALMAMVLSR